MKRYVIIGNGVAAAGCIEGIRSADQTGEITVISEEKHPVYCRPLISYYLEGKTALERMGYRSDNFYDKNKVSVLYGRTATHIIPDSKKVELMGHESYDRLYHLNTVNSLHSRIKAMFRQLRGVASKYLNRYLALFTIIASCVKSTIAESADDLRRSLSAVRVPITYISSQTEGLLAL